MLSKFLQEKLKAREKYLAGDARPALSRNELYTFIHGSTFPEKHGMTAACHRTPCRFADIPEQYWQVNPKNQQATLRLTGCTVAPNGDIFVTDGYASDYIHRFNAAGEYLATFGGKEAPYLFKTLHKIAIDPRFDPPRLVGMDRTNNRVVHLSLEGELLGEISDDLRVIKVGSSRIGIGIGS